MARERLSLVLLALFVLSFAGQIVAGAQGGEVALWLYDHLEVTERQIGRLEKIFKGLGKSPRSNKKCKGMESLLEEAPSCSRRTPLSRARRKELQARRISALTAPGPETP